VKQGLTCANADDRPQRQGHRSMGPALVVSVLVSVDPGE
jgi:hypothetical protein